MFELITLFIVMFAIPVGVGEFYPYVKEWIENHYAFKYGSPFSPDMVVIHKDVHIHREQVGSALNIGMEPDIESEKVERYKKIIRRQLAEFIADKLEIKYDVRDLFRERGIPEWEMIGRCDLWTEKK